VTYIVAICIYNNLFHPLSSYPGPFIWTSTRIRHSLSTVTGQIHRDAAKLHAKYGPVVRIAPDELSYATGDAWNDIYAWQTTQNGDRYQLIKHPLLYTAPATTGVHGIITTPSDKDHGRMKRNLSHGFSDKSLRDQEPLIMHYISLLIEKLKERCYVEEKTNSEGEHEKGRDGVLDIVAWYNFTNFDIIGDLTFGESFESMHTQDDWIKSMAELTKVGLFICTTNRFVSISPAFIVRGRIRCSYHEK
jgi:hypothetical protein